MAWFATTVGMTEEQKASKLKWLEEIKELLIQLSNELLLLSDSHIYTALHLNEAKNILTRVQREIEKC